MSFLPGMGSILGESQIVMGVNTSKMRGQTRQGINAVRDEVRRGADQVSAQQKRWDAAFGIIGKAAKVGMVGVVSAMGAAIGASIQFESSWAGVRKTLEATPAELEALRQQFRDLAKEIPVSVNELAHIGETAGALGIAKDDVLAFTKTVALIGQTTNVTTEEASTALGQLSNVLKMSSKDYSKFADTLVDLGNKGASTESQILQIASRAGSSAGLIGMATDEMLAYASSVASLGIEVEAGGSSLQNFFLKMNKYVGAGGDQLKTIAKVAGVSMKDFKKAYQQDAGWALNMFVEGLGKIDGSSQQVVLDLLKMNDIRITRMLLGLANGGDLLANNLNNAAGAWEANSAATEEFGKRAETTASQMGLIKNIIQDYLITLGDTLLPVFKEVVNFLKESLPKAIEFFAATWNDILLPPIEEAAQAFFDLFSTIGAAFNGGDKATDWAGVVKQALHGVASAVAVLVKVITPLARGLQMLIDNPVAGWAFKAVAGITALRIAIGLYNQLVMRANAKTVGLARLFGIGGKGAAAAATPESAALMGSASALDGSALNLDRAAGSLARSAMGGGAAGAMGGPGMVGGFKGSGPIRYGDNPAGSYAVGNNLMGPNGKFLAVGRDFKDTYIRDRRAMEAAGKGIVARTAAGVADGAAAAARDSRSFAGSALGLASKAFWPAMIAGMAVEFLKAPIGSFVEQNTKWKRAGALMKEDFIGGVMAWFQSNVIGSDTWVGRAEEMTIGSAKFKTIELAKLGITNATFDKLEAPIGTITHAQGVTEAAEQVSKGIARNVGESTEDWWKRIQGAVGPATAEAVKKVFDDPNNWDLNYTEGTFTDSVDPQISKKALSEINRILNIEVANEVTGMRASARAEYMRALSSYVTGAGYTAGEMATLSGPELERLGKVAQVNADGSLNWINDMLLAEFIDGVAKAPKKNAATGSNAETLKKVRKALGKGWNADMESVLSGPADNAGEREIRKKLAAALGKNWREQIRALYREITPTLPAMAGDPTKEGLKELNKRAAAAVMAYYGTVPDAIKAGIEQAQADAAAQGASPETIEAIKTTMEAQYHDALRQGLEAFAGQVEKLPPDVVDHLKTKFGEDWVIAFADGTAKFGKSKLDQRTQKQLAVVFGERWKETLAQVGQITFLKEGGADAANLKKALAAAIGAQIGTLTAADLGPDATGKGDTKARNRVTKYLSSTAGKAALSDASGSDADKAAKGVEALGKALKKAGLSPKKVDAFVNMLVALQRAATAPLGGVNRFIADIPTTASNVNDLGSAIGHLDERVQGLLRTLGESPSGGGGGGGSKSNNTKKPRSPGDRVAGATGLLFDTSGTTHLTVGEAGREHVAVLRAPRKLPMSSMLGKNVVSDVVSGLTRVARTNPRALPFVQRGESSGPRVLVQADRLQLFTQGQKDSVATQLNFLAPDAR